MRLERSGTTGDNPPMSTLGSKLDENRGIGPGFDFLRLFLAFGIVAWHSVVVTGNWTKATATPLWFSEYLLVPMFFALSGFLVCASGLRLRLKDFLINRGLRIVPALAVEIIFSALIIGPIFTTWALNAYFSDPLFWGYFTNIFGFIKYFLPGVFEANPYKPVNGALWTIPYEIGCYVLISVLIVTGLLRSALVIAVCAIAFLAASIVVDVSGASAGAQGIIRNAYNFILVGHGAKLFPAFLLGCLAYLLRYRIPYDWRLLTLAVVACIVIAIFGEPGWIRWPALHIVMMPIVVYITAYIGVTSIPEIPLYSRGDYSYGIYLYHVPFAQALVALFPWLTGYWWLHLLMMVPLMTAVAAFSWHVIEKPILRLRKRFSFVATVRGVDEAGVKPATSVRSNAAGAPHV
jgi:peptidoglycan/LPS O-acetylase OafA/YrhL